MQLNPARGRKPILRNKTLDKPHILVYAAQPREGTETQRITDWANDIVQRFMQLNPARGRKLKIVIRCVNGGYEVYAAQPREGTETPNRSIIIIAIDSTVYAAQPREGTETRCTLLKGRYNILVYAAQPREGTETLPGERG